MRSFVLPFPVEVFVGAGKICEPIECVREGAGSLSIEVLSEQISETFLLEDHYSPDKVSDLKRYLNPLKSNGAWTWENPEPTVNLLKTLRQGTVPLPRPVRDSRKVPSGEDPDETDKNLDDWLTEYVEGIEE